MTLSALSRFLRLPIANQTGRQYFSTRLLNKKLDLSLYLVKYTDYTADPNSYISNTKKAIEGGVTYIQVWDDPDLNKTYQAAKAIKKIFPHVCVNNHVGIALALGIGVHLGKQDMPFTEARRLMGKHALIGYTPKTIQDAIDAENYVDYLGVQVFRSKRTHPAGEPLGLKVLRTLRSVSKLPIVAIGGITPRTVAPVYKILNIPGDGVAMVGQLDRGKNPKKVAEQMTKIYEKVKEKKGKSK